ncbi:hypothetical protein MST22_11730 [Virgibacillus halodenitrificans]|uniref:hypothetical protein n=1 Tax=Virgibacillus halodenitrificans TaxID=1482 RepID=UPI001FB1F768|nr:hypothetical protein [Virgibacillus halodenitrificans]MCJ0931824.1 hypothetical protein [Virgibacillus halodenitrificans]
MQRLRIWCEGILEEEFENQVDSFTWEAGIIVRNIRIIIEEYIENDDGLKGKLN